MIPPESRIPDPDPRDTEHRTQTIAANYNRWSTLYDDNINATRDLDAAVLRRAPLDLAGRQVVEFGCGTGKNTVWLAERAQSVLALDVSEGMLARARERVQRDTVRFVQQDILSRWPLDDGRADVVVGNLVLEHVEHLAPVFHEAARVLRRGGQLFCSELHPYRQLRGVQARFVDPDTHETILVPAFAHTTSDYVSGALAHGFLLRALGEWTEPGANAGVPPRLLTLLFERA